MDLFVSSQFTAHVEELLQQHHVPGLAVALTHKDQVVSKGFGQASLDPSRPCTPDTLFDIASASKSLTAASVALLVDDEKYPEVQWDAKMSELLPQDFVMAREEYTREVTVEDILGHRSGFPRHDCASFGPTAARPDNARSVTRKLRSLSVVAPVRSTFTYCNIMYTVATHLVETKTKTPFPDFLEQRFFQPLGMSSTNLQASRARSKGLGDRIATGHEWGEKAQKYTSFPPWDAPQSQGASCIVTSVNDYIKWVKALMSKEPPINTEIYKGLLKTRSLRDPGLDEPTPMTSPSLYGAGLESFFYRGYLIVKHDGSMPGFGSTFFFLPQLNFGGILMGNSGNVGVLIDILSHELFDAVIGVPEAERTNWNALKTTEWDEDEEKYTGETERKRVIKMLCGEDLTEFEPQKMPLAVYVGEYWNTGYQEIKVEIRNGKLFADCTDRDLGTFDFEHVRDQTCFLAYLRDSRYEDGEDNPFGAQFVFDNDKVTKIGMEFETKMKELIWFDRVEAH